MTKQRTRRTVLELVGAAIIISAISFGACGTRAGVRATITPSMRQTAVDMYLRGASSEDVAERLRIEHGAARELLRATISELQRAYERDR